MGPLFWNLYSQDVFNSANPNNQDMLYYWNFIFTNESSTSTRVRFNAMNIFEQVGGVLAALQGILGSFFFIYTYKQNIKFIFQEVEKTEGSEHLVKFPWFFSIRMWLYDLYSPVYNAVIAVVGKKKVLIDDGHDHG